MPRIVRRVAVAGAVVALILLFLVLRPRGSNTTPPTQSPTTAPSATPRANPANSPAPPVAEEIRIRVRNGRVQGPGRLTVDSGSRVRIVVTSDASDEVHVHGYDLKEEVSPGRAATLELEATIPGVFEVELENAGLLLVRLEVTS